MIFVQNILNDKIFQISMTAAIVFLVVAFPPLFSTVDKLLASVLGTKIGKNYYTVLVIHASSSWFTNVFIYILYFKTCI